MQALQPEQLRALEDPLSNYSYGWSHGKENFNGSPDMHKGSWYGELPAFYTHMLPGALPV